MAASAPAIPAAIPAALAKDPPEIPEYRCVTRFKPVPAPFSRPGQVSALYAADCIDTASERVNIPVMKEMMSAGMRSLTGDSDPRDSWSRFLSPSDVVGIKVNCSGAPGIMSTPEVVAEIVRNAMSVGVSPENITIYERFPDQMKTVHYETYVPKDVHVDAVELQRRSIVNYDPDTYVEVNFFGEEDTRSNMVRMVTQRFTKIINVPNMKDHGAAGVTGCLKNMAYGDFSNVARSHYQSKTNTYSFIGTLAAMEPLRSRTVLHVMDGLRGVWQGGPFSTNRKFRFYPKKMMFGTDPVAMDRLLIDIIEEKRKSEGAISVWDRSMEDMKRAGDRFIREPGHIEYAGSLGLGIYDIGKIVKKSVEL
ncbi:MAG: DUF362 domain-containing protein [Acidobacteriota bacterium]|nr:DUF362 domain-containing protein [Acidobacteriota bacterium]